MTDKRESKSRPGEGIVTFAHTGRNQHGDVVATASRTTMVRKRPEGDRLMALGNQRPGWLFCPADRPERFAKAAAAADVVILDLEDGVAGEGPRSGARRADRHPAGPGAHRGADQPSRHRRPAPDLEALAKTAYTTVMLAKTEDAAAGRGAGAAGRHRADRDPARRGVGRRDSAAHGNAFALMWGAEDLVAATGRQRQPVARRQLSRRRQARPVAGAAGGEGLRAAGAGLGVPRHQGPRRAAGRGRRRRRGRIRRQGAIHPTQVAVVRDAYAPTDDQVDWARHVLEAARDERGVFEFEGIMVDAPVLRRAERIVQLAPHPGT